MARVLVYSHDRVGRTMSGPGIRYYHVARELAREYDVTLMAPGRSDLDAEGIAVEPAPRAGDLDRALRRFDVIVAQYLPPATMRRLARGSQRVIYDLYVPFVTEGLGKLAGGASRTDVLHWRSAALVQRTALATGNAFVCASETQRDLYVGMLAALGRLEPGADPDELIRIVPFGLPDEPPARAPAPRPTGVAEGDLLLLWAGGIWDWLDPLTPIRAVERLVRAGRPVKLLLLGAKHPDLPESVMAGRAEELARSLGVLDRHVFLERRWLPYADRAGYLLSADVGVTAHPAGVEARYSFRTRVLDHLWAGLPTIATCGDPLSEFVERHGLGRTVAPGDVDGWMAALEALRPADVRARISERVRDVRPEFAWSRVVAPLAELVRGSGEPVATRRAAARLELERLCLQVRLARAEHGWAEVGRRAAGRLLGRGL